MKVLFSSTWGLGHVFPMVPLAHAFSAAGHDVLWVAPDLACPALRAAGIEVRSGGLSGPMVQAAFARMKELTAPFPPPQRAAVAFRVMFAAQATPAMLADLLPVARAWGPDLMIHEPAELAAPLVAAVLGLRAVTHSWGPAIPAEILVGAGEEVAELWADHDVAVPDYAGSFRGGYLDLCPPSVQYVPTDHIPHMLGLRPVPYAGKGQEAEDSDGLGRPEDGDDRPLIYVTLGTVFLDSSVLQAAVNAAARTGARVVATVGPQGDPARITRPSEAVQVRRWVPQSTILPRADLLVSHAGSGTFLGALSAGCPQLCLPQAADQFRNATAVARSGTGLTLAPDQVGPEALDAALEELLRDPTYQLAAARVAGEIQQMPPPAAVVGALTRRN